MELSPEDIRKDKGKIIPQDFKIYIFFDNFCDTCRPEKTKIEDLCAHCKQELGPQIIKEWIEVRDIIYNHDYPDRKIAEVLLRGVDPELEKFTLERPLQFNPEYYRFWNEEELKKTDEELQAEKRDSLENKDKPEEGIKKPSIPFNRRTSQCVLSFPVMEMSQ